MSVNDEHARVASCAATFGEVQARYDGFGLRMHDGSDDGDCSVYVPYGHLPAFAAALHARAGGFVAGQHLDFADQQLTISDGWSDHGTVIMPAECLPTFIGWVQALKLPADPTVGV